MFSSHLHNETSPKGSIVSVKDDLPTTTLSDTSILRKMKNYLSNLT